MTSAADAGDRPKAFSTRELLLAGLIATVPPDSPAAVFAFLCRRELIKRVPGAPADDLPHDEKQ